MERNNAKQLMEIYNSIGELLNRADPIIRNISDGKLKAELIKPLGEVMADVWLKLERLIIKIYPELDPDRGRNNEKRKNLLA